MIRVLRVIRTAETIISQTPTRTPSIASELA